MSADAVAAALARTVQKRIQESRTLTQRGTVTAVGLDGIVEFSVGSLGTRFGVHLGEPPAVGDYILYLDEGRGMPLVLGTAGKAAAWTTYTPTWTAATTPPTLGDGVLAGGFKRHGCTLHVRGRLNVGSTSTVGSGDLRLALPSGITVAAGMQQTMAAFWYDAGTATLTPGVAIAQASAAYVQFQFAAVGTFANSNGLANGDEINFTGTIEVAL